MILYFSGTGNSEYAARIIAEKTGDELINLNHRIKAGIGGNFVSGNPFVLVCPTYAWRIPRVVEEYIRTASFSGSEDMYVILTCGSGTAGAQRYAKRLCEEKGLNLKGFKTVIMPENYIALFNVPDKDESKKIVEKATLVIEEAADLIAARQPINEKLPALGSVMSKLVNDVFFAFIVKDKGFHLEKTCISCGKCVQLCPLNNIELIDGKPVWGGKCTHCMACICGCPAQCIEYKKASRKRRRYWFGG